MNPEFSIVIPTIDNLSDVQKIIARINCQSLLPHEIVIADSSASNEIEEGIHVIKSSVPINYLRVGRAYPFDRFLNYLFSLPFLSQFKSRYPAGRAFPYEATNAGSAIAKSEWLAFLDATTIPSDKWLEDYWHVLKSGQYDVVFGNTKYLATSRFQKILRASTYGRLGHESAPGSIMKKSIFLDGYMIQEGVRSGGDVAWKIDIKNSLRYFLPNEHYLTYSNLSLKILPTLKKFFIYQMYGSLLNIQNNIKDLYFGLALMLSLIILPKWNYIVGWESAFFIPHITKLIFISILLIAGTTFFINRVLLRGSPTNSFFMNGLKFVALLITSYSVFRWNDVAANWVEDSIWYVPHITKIFLLTICVLSFVYRGMYFPMKHGIKPSYLFPFRWILVGALGIVLDMVKAPGYLLGAIFAPFIRR